MIKICVNRDCEKAYEDGYNDAERAAEAYSAHWKERYLELYWKYQELYRKYKELLNE